MKRATVWIIPLVAVVGLSGWLAGASFGKAEAEKKPLMHVVLFRMKKDAPKTAAADMVRDAHELLEKIPVVNELHAGTPAPATREYHVKDYDMALSLRLKNESEMSAYLDHPLHLEYVDKHGKNVENIRVCDFYSE